MENTKVNVTVKYEDGKPAILLIGEANTPEVTEKFKAVVFTGLIDAPVKFLKDKVGAKLIDKNKVLIIVDEVSETIQALTDYGNELRHEVTGKLIRNPFVGDMKINDPTKRYGLKELISLLKFRRKLFSNQEEFNQLMNTLMAFTAKVEGDVKAENDRKGNISEAFIMKTKSNLKLDFTLEAAIFKGGPVAKFKVDIFFDVQSLNSFVFYFESADYHDLALAQGHDLIETQLKELEGYTVIHK